MSRTGKCRDRAAVLCRFPRPGLDTRAFDVPIAVQDLLFQAGTTYVDLRASGRSPDRSDGIRGPCPAGLPLDAAHTGHDHATGLDRDRPALRRSPSCSRGFETDVSDDPLTQPRLLLQAGLANVDRSLPRRRPDLRDRAGRPGGTDSRLEVTQTGEDHTARVDLSSRSFHRCHPFLEWRESQCISRSRASSTRSSRGFIRSPAAKEARRLVSASSRSTSGNSNGRRYPARKRSA